MEAIIIVVSLRGLNGLILVKFLDLYQAYSAQKRLILCWFMRNVTPTNLLHLWCESGTFLPVHFQVTDAVRFKSHRFSDLETQYLVSGSSFSAMSLNVGNMLIQFSNSFTHSLGTNKVSCP